MVLVLTGLVPSLDDGKSGGTISPKSRIYNDG
jgi:hypothetical protein